MKKYTEDELQRIKLKILNREICICETCDTLFDYVPQKKFCKTCAKIRWKKHYAQRRDKRMTAPARLHKQLYDKRRKTIQNIVKLLDE